MRFIKLLLGFVLLPACWAVSEVFVRQLVTLSTTAASTVSMSVWGLVIGFLLWLFIYMVLPRPMRTYVLAHELTHALWGWVMGAKIKGIRVTNKGGHVKLTRTNFLITLAPYFFPFYTVLVILLYALLHLFFDLSMYEPLWFGWVGLTWAFHLTFTLSMLRTHQPDIAEHGRLFSYTVIYLFNLLGLSAGIVALSAITWSAWGTDIWTQLITRYEQIFDIGLHYGDLLYQEFILR